jgi:CheY-like chemotaxis protein
LNTGNGKIIICDNSPEILEVTRLVLESTGYEVLCSNNSVDLFEIVKANQPDLIIMDILLAEVSGMEVIEVLRSDKATKEIPIILFSTANFCEKLACSLKIPFLKKPFDIYDLEKMVEEVLTSHTNKVIL